MDQFAQAMQNATPEQIRAGMQMFQNMTPEQWTAQMAQAQQHMAKHMEAKKEYMVKGAEALKEEGNASFTRGMYAEALSRYSRGLENLRGHEGNAVESLLVTLLNNSAVCHLKMKNFKETVSKSEEALKVDPTSFKALWRMGLAKAELGDVEGAVSNVERAAALSPGNKAIADELKQLQAKLRQSRVGKEGLNNQRSSPCTSQLLGLPATNKSATASTCGSSRASTRSPSPCGSGQEPAVSDKRRADAVSLEQMDKVLTMMSKPEGLAEIGSSPLPAPMKNMMSMMSEHLQKNPETVQAMKEHLHNNPEVLRAIQQSMQQVPADTNLTRRTLPVCKASSTPRSSPATVRVGWFLAGVGVGAVAMRWLASMHRK
jgi:tetratricopeptide (TPR) repeat protein